MKTWIQRLAIALGLVLGFFIARWGLDAAGYRLRLEPNEGHPAGPALDFSGTPPARLEPPIPGPARNLVLLIGDGMGFSQLTAARMALRGPNGRLVLERFPATGWSSTHSADEVYTDSAAGATALATGAKTRPKKISVDPDDQPLETFFERARDLGKAVGVVTDSQFFDATPAAFLSHRSSRYDGLGIAEDMLASGAMVIVGETHRRLEADDRWPEILGAAEAAGWVRASELGELEGAAPGASVFGLFAPGSIADPERPPELPELVSAVLERLAADPEGFVLLIETEETDTASHRGDFERMVRGVATLDAVAEQVVEFARRDGQTLVVATADHETGGLALLGGRDGEPLEIRWGTSSHTAEPVPLLAYGPGAGAFVGVHDNTEVGRLLAAALDLPRSAP